MTVRIAYLYIHTCIFKFHSFLCKRQVNCYINICLAQQLLVPVVKFSMTQIIPWPLPDFLLNPWFFSYSQTPGFSRLAVTHNNAQQCHTITRTRLTSKSNNDNNNNNNNLHLTEKLLHQRIPTKFHCALTILIQIHQNDGLQERVNVERQFICRNMV